MSTVVSARGFEFRHASRKRKALQGIDLDIQAGEKVLLLGESGSGKSTLLSAIAGLFGPEEGERGGKLEVHGIVGMVLQDPDSQVIANRVGDDVAFGCENLCYSREEIKRRIPEALALVGLDLPLDYPTVKLSGGQKQRLALAGVMAMGADIILLDEPTANLDPEGVRAVVQAVEQVASRTGATVIIIEHRVDVWAHVVDRALVLGEQAIMADGPIDTVIEEQGAQLASRGVWIPGYDPSFAPLPQSQGEYPVIETHRLVSGWEPGQSQRVLDLSIPSAASTVISGDNGQGKTTLQLTLAGLLKPLSGDVLVHPAVIDLGHDKPSGWRRKHNNGSRNPYDWSSTVLSTRFGYVFQDPEHQFLHSTVREELALGADPTRIDEVLERLRLSELAEANPFTLSGGQKRRLSVATALVSRPDVLFLDEPTFGQDRLTFIELVTMLRESIQQGVSLIAVTHDELFQQALGQYHLHLDAHGIQERTA